MGRRKKVSDEKLARDIVGHIFRDGASQRSLAQELGINQSSISHRRTKSKTLEKLIIRYAKEMNVKYKPQPKRGRYTQLTDEEFTLLVFDEILLAGKSETEVATTNNLCINTFTSRMNSEKVQDLLNDKVQAYFDELMVDREYRPLPFVGAIHHEILIREFTKSRLLKLAHDFGIYTNCAWWPDQTIQRLLTATEGQSLDICRDNVIKCPRCGHIPEADTEPGLWRCKACGSESTVTVEYVTSLTQPSIICDQCQGKGEYELERNCGNCSGAGVLDESYCYYCNGTGHVRAYRAGKSKCDACHGTGRLKQRKCDRCDGSGTRIATILCHRCNKTGRVLVSVEEFNKLSPKERGE